MPPDSKYHLLWSTYVDGIDYYTTVNHIADITPTMDPNACDGVERGWMVLGYLGVFRPTFNVNADKLPVNGGGCSACQLTAGMVSYTPGDLDLQISLGPEEYRLFCRLHLSSWRHS